MTPRERKIPAFTPGVQLVTSAAIIVEGQGAKTGGTGGAAAYFAYCQERIEWILRMPIYPGTFNLYLDGNYHLISPWQSVEPQDFLMYTGARSVTCTVNDIPGLILRTDLPGGRTEFEIVCCTEVPNVKGQYHSAVTVVFENRPV
jgi:CTP-dependent riboflavin kinase